MRYNRDDLPEAWRELVELCCREERVVVSWLLHHAVKGLGREIEEVEQELLAAERFPGALAVIPGLGYLKDSAEETRAARAASNLTQLRAMLRVLLAAQVRLDKAHEARFTEFLRQYFAERSK